MKKNQMDPWFHAFIKCTESEWVGIVKGEVGGAINEQKGALTFWVTGASWCFTVRNMGVNAALWWMWQSCSLNRSLIFNSWITPTVIVWGKDTNADQSHSSIFTFLSFMKLVLGPSGVLQGIRPGKCYVEMSTVDPETITELSQVNTSMIQ